MSGNSAQLYLCSTLHTTQSIQKCVRGKQNKTKGDKHNRGKGGSAVMVKKKQIKQLTGLFLCVCFIRISFESCEKITAIIDQHKEKSR